MRVIAGSFRGRPLEAPQGRTTRPITDRAKETIFNILGSKLGTLADLPDVDVADVFAGSGSFGIECLSRGARSCVFIERDRAALTALRKNLSALPLAPAQAKIAVSDAWRTTPTQPAAAGFGLIFVDPPYRDVEDSTRVVTLLDRLASILAQDGLLVFRHEATTAFDAGQPTGLSCVDDRTLGGMRVLIYAASRTDNRASEQES